VIIDFHVEYVRLRKRFNGPAYATHMLVPAGNYTRIRMLGQYFFVHVPTSQNQQGVECFPYFVRVSMPHAWYKDGGI
jgi:hypothetical protein